MRENLSVAKRFRLSRRKFRGKPEYKALISKCYYAYVFQCVIKSKQTFTLYFGSHYMQGFGKRLFDWCNYVLDCAYQFYLVHFTPNDDKTFKKYELIHYKVNKPMHMRIAYSVNEMFLEYYLKEMGFKVVDEQIGPVSSVYEIAKI